MTSYEEEEEESFEENDNILVQMNAEEKHFMKKCNSELKRLGVKKRDMRERKVELLEEFRKKKLKEIDKQMLCLANRVIEEIEKEEQEKPQPKKKIRRK